MPELEAVVAALVDELAAPEDRPDGERLADERSERAGLADDSRQPRRGAALVAPLTAREVEVLRLLAAGQTNREIAEQIVVVVGTVKAHLNSIFGKLGARNRVEAVARARELGLLS